MSGCSFNRPQDVHESSYNSLLQLMTHDLCCACLLFYPNEYAERVFFVPGSSLLALMAMLWGWPSPARCQFCVSRLVRTRNSLQYLASLRTLCVCMRHACVRGLQFSKLGCALAGQMVIDVRYQKRRTNGVKDALPCSHQRRELRWRNPV